MSAFEIAKDDRGRRSLRYLGFRYYTLNTPNMDKSSDYFTGESFSMRVQAEQNKKVMDLRMREIEKAHSASACRPVPLSFDESAKTACSKCSCREFQCGFTAQRSKWITDTRHEEVFTASPVSRSSRVLVFRC